MSGHENAVERATISFRMSQCFPDGEIMKIRRRVVVALALMLLVAGCGPVGLGMRIYKEIKPPSSEEYREAELIELSRQGNVPAHYELGELYLGRAQVSEGYKHICIAAQHGVPQAQIIVAYFYEGRSRIIWASPEPSPMKLNPLKARMWYSLAASGGIPEAVFFRDGLTERMRADQIAEAEQLAKNWKPNPEACKKPPYPKLAISGRWRGTVAHVGIPEL